jgi:hypothetical protein
MRGCGRLMPVMGVLVPMLITTVAPAPEPGRVRVPGVVRRQVRHLLLESV